MPGTYKTTTHKSSPARPKDHKFPAATAHDVWRYHHLGIPTQISHPDEKYLSEFGMFVFGFEPSRNEAEWMRFEKTNPFPGFFRTVPHIAFVADGLEAALGGRELLSGISVPSNGVCAAMTVENGAPIERMEFRGQQE
jgi:hypothetical protein